MKTNKRIQSIIKKMMDSVYHIDVMSPEFKAANAELLKAIKMNDKSGAIPHAELEAINKAMKANDGKQAAELLKKVQLKLSKAEKALDDAVKESLQRLSETKKESENASLKLKETKAIAPLFEKAKSIADSVKTNPANIKKLSAIAPKIKAYGDINDKLNKITDLVNKNKDASKQIDMLKRAIETAEKKYKKDYAAIEKAAKSAKDKLEVHSMQAKITQGKKDAFQKERLYLANAVKQTPGAELTQERDPKEEQKQKLPPREVSKVLMNKMVKARALYKRSVEEMNKAISEYENSNSSKFVNEGEHEKELKRMFANAESTLAESKDPKTKLIYNWLKKISASFNAKGDIDKGSTDALYDMSKVSNEARKAVKPIIDYYNKYRGMREHLENTNFNGISQRTIQNIKEQLKNGDIETAMHIMSNYMYEPKTAKAGSTILSDVRYAVNNYRKKLKLPELKYQEFLKAISGNDYINKLLY